MFRTIFLLLSDFRLGEGSGEIPMFRTIFLLLTLFCACAKNPPSNGQAPTPPPPPEAAADSLDDNKAKAWFVNMIDELADADGDGKQEEMNVHWLNSITNKELALPEGIEFDSMVAYAIQNEPKCFVTFSNPAIDTLFVAEAAQLFGLLWLKNEGDLNEDGNDELSLVVDWADWSNLNTCHVYSLRKGDWHKLASFPIRESDTDYAGEEQALKFDGWITKKSKGKILVKTYDEEGIDVEKELIIK